jgi:hypothetical protein
MAANDLEGLSVFFLFHLVLDLIDHNEFGVDGLKVSSRLLEDDSTFGAGDDFGSSLHISHIEKLFLLKFLYFFMNLSACDILPDPPVEFEVEYKELVIHAICGYSVE